MAIDPTLAMADSQTNIENSEDSGLEIEIEDPQERIINPFNPEQIKIRTVHVVVEQIVSRIRHDEIDLAPDFQRQLGIWNRKRQSRLVESLLLRIPIPVFYVAADPHDNWMVIDGIQRMGTLYDYVTGEFSLTELEYLTRLNNSKYADLARPFQRRISETQLIVNVVEPGTSDEVMHNVFNRINTGGLPLRGQEIRHALHPGPVREFLQNLAESDEFLKATDNSIKTERMADRECVLRFAAFYICSWEIYRASDLNGFLVSAMKEINGMSKSGRMHIAAAFRKAMQAAFDIFGQDAFRNPTHGKRRPVSRALFDGWAVLLAQCETAEIDCLVQQREGVRCRFRQMVHEDTDFEKSISTSTGSQKSVRKRFATIEKIIQESLTNAS